jgi:hypothetical protein
MLTDGSFTARWGDYPVLVLPAATVSTERIRLAARDAESCWGGVEFDSVAEGFAVSAALPASGVFEVVDDLSR